MSYGKLLNGRNYIMLSFGRVGQDLGRNIIENKLLINLGSIRFASKKTSSSTRNSVTGGVPKHRGWKFQDGAKVTQGTILATQYKLRFCPGLNVGAGAKGTLFAKVGGRVVITCEKADFNPENNWVKKWYSDRTGVIYKKYFNVIPEPQHQRFKLVDQI